MALQRESQTSSLLLPPKASPLKDQYPKIVKYRRALVPFEVPVDPIVESLPEVRARTSTSVSTVMSFRM